VNDPVHPSGSDSDSHLPSPELALTALRFAAGELSDPAATAFAARVAADPLAQDALEEAMRLSAAALGQSLPMPDPLLQDVVRDRIRPKIFARLFPRRPYHGHPATWAGLGGISAAVLTVFGVWLGEQPAPPHRIAPTVSASFGPDLTQEPLPAGPTVLVSRESATRPTVIVEMSPTTEANPTDTAVATTTTAVVATVPKPVPELTTHAAEPEARPHELKAAVPHDATAPPQ
jgi:hypothetical protein